MSCSSSSVDTLAYAATLLLVFFDIGFTATSKRDIQKAMGDKIAELGMRLSILASEARRDDICFIDGKMVTDNLVCDQEDW